MNKEEIQGKWQEIKGLLHEKWGQITDDDWMRTEGNIEAVIGVVQQRTGEARQTIERVVKDLYTAANGVAQRMSNSAKEYSQDAVDAVKRGYDHATDTVKDGYNQATDKVQEGIDQAKHVVRRNPVESVAVVFGAGVIAGIIASLFFRRPR